MQSMHLQGSSKYIDYLYRDSFKSQSGTNDTDYHYHKTIKDTVGRNDYLTPVILSKHTHSHNINMHLYCYCVAISVVGIIIFTAFGNADTVPNVVSTPKNQLVEQQMTMRFATWNIDTNFSRLEDGYAQKAFPQWKVKNRMEAITRTIDKVNPDIIHVQELRNKTNANGELINSSDPLQDFLKNQGYGVVVRHYNAYDLATPGADPGAFQYLTAYKLDKFRAEESVSYPMVTEDTHQTNSRHTLVTTLKHISTDQIIRTYNVHMDPGEYRFEQSRAVFKLVHDCLQSNPKSRIIVGGDFNAFLDQGGERQIEIFTQSPSGAKLSDVTSSLSLPNGERILGAKSTFFYYPYDFGPQETKILQMFGEPRADSEIQEALQKIGIPPEFTLGNNNFDAISQLESPNAQKLIKYLFEKCCKAKGGHLDHILVYNLKANGSAILEVSPQFEPPPLSYTEDAVMSYILAHIHSGPAFASDHQMVWVDLFGESSHLTV
jgi:endonuclease/exonuclease/phosphatase family metal-dependent hydrolase